MTAVGTYAGNAGDSPAHTSSVDYFFNTALPVSPEDKPCTEWIGAIDSDWDHANNWSLSTPDSSTSAIIPDISNSKNVFPVISSLAECSNLIVENGATLDIAENGMLTIRGIFLNNGGTTIHSDATGTGSFIDNGYITGTGNIYDERFLTDTTWHYVSVPVDDPTAAVFLGMYVMEWDEPSGQWSYITDPAQVLDTDMEGYAVWTNEISTVQFTGDRNTGPKSIAASFTSGATHDNKGFNFAGNPYPSALDWNVDDGSGWSRTVGNIDLSLYIWNGEVGNYGSYVKDAAGGTNDVDNVIPPHQGFFVSCSSPTGTLGVNNGARMHGNQNILKSGENEDESFLLLKVEGNGYADEAMFRIDEQATTGFDHSRDARDRKSVV